MSDNNVFLVLQSVEDAKPIIEAIKKDNPNAVIQTQPAMIKITASRRLTIQASTMEDIIGRTWDPQELQLVLVTLAGNVDEDYDHFTLYWDN